MARLKKLKEEEASATAEEAPVAKEAPARQQPKGKRIACAGGGPLAARRANKEQYDENNAVQNMLLGKLLQGVGFTTVTEDNERKYLPYPWMAMQYLTGERGIQVETLSEIFGTDALGKSSLTCALLTSFIQLGCHCVYINTESKKISTQWIREHLCGTDPELANDTVSVLHQFDHLHTFEDVDKFIRNWVFVKRHDPANPAPISEPIVIVIDSLAGLVRKDTLDNLTTGSDSKVGMQKGLDDVTIKMCSEASWLHKWTKHLAPWMHDNNVTVICTNAKNQNVNLIKPAEKKDRTKTGGEALNQKVATQISLTKAAAKYSPADGVIPVVAYGTKVSNGGPNREIMYYVKTDTYFNDPDYKKVAGYYEQSIDMSETLANILLDHNVLGFTSNRKKYTSEELGICQLTPAEFEAKVNADPELQRKIGQALHIKGYEDD